MGATCTAAQTHMHSQLTPSQEFDRNGAKSGGVDALPLEWRPLLRSDRLLGPPCADRQSFGCSPAIEDISMQYPQKHARVSEHMSGKRRSSTLATRLGELVADGSRTNGKRAQTVPMVGAATARRFPAVSRAGRAAPATCGKRVPPDEGVVKRGHACTQSRRTYSYTGAPAGSKSESVGRDRWPPPSDRVTTTKFTRSTLVLDGRHVHVAIK
jgi:hypothetical protein